MGLVLQRKNEDLRAIGHLKGFYGMDLNTFISW